MKPVAIDLGRLWEDSRIDQIGRGASCAIVGVMIESDSEKIDRYKKKILERHPNVRFVSSSDLTDGITLLKFGPIAGDKAVN